MITDVQIRLDVVPLSSYSGFVELTEGCPAYEYTNQSNNSSTLHPFYGGIDIIDHKTNDFHFTVEFEKGNLNTSVATPAVGRREFWVITNPN